MALVKKLKESPVKILIDLNHRESTFTGNGSSSSSSSSSSSNGALISKSTSINSSTSSALNMIDIDSFHISSSINIERFDSEDRSDLESSFETSFDNDRKAVLDRNLIVDKQEVLSLLSFCSTDNDTSAVMLMDFDDEDKSDLLETSIDHQPKS